MGPIFRERVIAPPAAPLIATAADALAVTLNETGRVDIDHLAELLDRDPETALAQLGDSGVPQSRHRSLGDRRRLSLGFRPHQAGACRGGGRARSAVCAQRRRAAARAARGPASVGHHRASRRAVDSRRRHRGVRRRGDGHRDMRAPHRRDRLLVRGHRAVRRHRRRHLGMGHRAAQRRLAAARRAEQRHAADLRHHRRGRRGEARAQQRGDRGRQGEAGADQGRLHRLDLDRSRTAPTGWRASTTTASTTWCRAGSTDGI